MTDAVVTRITMAIQVSDLHGATADRRWLRPLIEAPFPTAPQRYRGGGPVELWKSGALPHDNLHQRSRCRLGLHVSNGRSGLAGDLSLKPAPGCHAGLQGCSRSILSLRERTVETRIAVVRHPMKVIVAIRVVDSVLGLISSGIDKRKRVVCHVSLPERPRYGRRSGA